VREREREKETGSSLRRKQEALSEGKRKLPEKETGSSLSEGNRKLSRKETGGTEEATTTKERKQRASDPTKQN